MNYSKDKYLRRTRWWLPALLGIAACVALTVNHRRAQQSSASDNDTASSNPEQGTSASDRFTTAQRPQLPGSVHAKPTKDDGNAPKLSQSEVELASNAPIGSAKTARELAAQIRDIKKSSASYHELSPTLRAEYSSAVETRAARRSQKPVQQRFASTHIVFRGDVATPGDALLGGGVR